MAALPPRLLTFTVFILLETKRKIEQTIEQKIERPRGGVAAAAADAHFFHFTRDQIQN